MTLLAAIDMGTGGMRTFYVRMQPNGLPAVESRKGYVYSLGKEIRQGTFSQQRIDEALAAFLQAVADIRTSGALLVGAIATEAFRAVDNGHVLLSAIAEQTGVRVRVISGEDELRLSYQGAASFIHENYQDIIFADGGGGSTEVAHISHHTGEVHNWTSLKIGVMTHLDGLYDEEITTPERFVKLKQDFADIIVTDCYKYNINMKNKPLVIAGTPFHLLRYKHKWEDQAPYSIPGDELTYAELVTMGEEMCRMGLSGRRDHPHIQASGAELLVPGVAKCMALMEICGVDKFQIVPSGLAIALVLQHSLKQPEVRYVG